MGRRVKDFPLANQHLKLSLNLTKMSTGIMHHQTILIIGGAGYIGSHVNALLQEYGYHTIVLDNLSRGDRNAVIHGTFIEGDLTNEQLMHDIFSKNKIDAVMHFAALTDVGESVVKPDRYYLHNVVYSMVLLKMLQHYQVKYFIFSSSAAVYGIPETQLIEENHPCTPINPYGHSKRAVEVLLEEIDRKHSMHFCSLRYFNAAGSDPKGRIKYRHRKESNLIPLLLNGLLSEEANIHINGIDYDTIDGTCVRDYVHVEDLAHAHIKAMERLFKGESSAIYNLGTGLGFSVRQVIDAVSSVTGRKIRVTERERRPGDPPVLVASAAKAERELGWKPKYTSLNEMILHSWNARQ